jgi:hypothetical protein
VIQKEQLVLPLVEVTNRGKQNRDVALLLPLDLSRRVFSSRGQVRTILRAIDLDQALGRTTHRADRLAKRRTRSSTFALTAGRAGHSPASHTRPQVDNQAWRGATTERPVGRKSATVVVDPAASPRALCVEK